MRAICGHCRFYQNKWGDKIAYCLKRGMEVGYLWEKPCFNQESDEVIMERLREQKKVQRERPAKRARKKHNLPSLEMLEMQPIKEGEKLKVCTHCNKALPLSFYRPMTKGAGGLRAECRVCEREYMRKLYERKKNQQ